MSKISLSPSPTGSAVYTIASPAGSTDRTLTLPDNSGTVITTATTTGIDASALSTGTVAAARLGSGTPDATNFLRGDGSWQVISTTPTTAQVLNATAGASVGAVGTYAMLYYTVGGSLTEGSTTAGSNLRYAAANGGSNGAPAGTWRCMGYIAFGGNNNPNGVSVFLRIS